jgi:hypothetical protein
MTAAREAADGRVLHGIPIGGKLWDAIARLSAELVTRPRYVYPWDHLEADLQATGQPLLLAGYGSLLDATSAAVTLRPTAHGRRPVIAFGARRVFNYALEASSPTRPVAPADPLARAALNVYPRRDLSEVCNGVCLAVAPTDVPALRARETGYDLHPIVCVSWDAPHQPPFVAYVLGAPDGGHTDDRLRPHPAYYQLCRAGAASFSAEFLAFYLDTTYLADRRTTIRAWEQAGG